MDFVVVWIMRHFQQELVVLFASDSLSRRHYLNFDLSSLLSFQRNSVLILFDKSINHSLVVFCEVHKHWSTILLGFSCHYLFDWNWRLALRGYWLFLLGLGFGEQMLDLRLKFVELCLVIIGKCLFFMFFQSQMLKLIRYLLLSNLVEQLMNILLHRVVV